MTSVVFAFIPTQFDPKGSGPSSGEQKMDGSEPPKYNNKINKQKL